MQRLLAVARGAPSPSLPAQPPKRRYHELDWLRALIILLLVPAHALGFFTTTTAQYYGTQYSSPIGLSTMMNLGTWGIALLFLVAGASARFALATRSPQQYISERFLRLMVPFLFASLTLIPLQDYLILHNFPGVVSQISAPPGWNPQYADSPVSFYLYFVGASLSYLVHYTPQYEFIFWSQLWFIPRLFVISLLTLPLLLYLRTERGAKAITWLADLCERRRGGVFLLAIPLGVVSAALGWQWQGWEVVGAPNTANVVSQFLFYAIVYVYGFVLYSDERLRQALRRDSGVVSLVVALIAFVAARTTWLGIVGIPSIAHGHGTAGFLVMALLTLADWLFVASALGLSMRYLTTTNRTGRYLTEASYPFYVLHLSVLYLIGLPMLVNRMSAVLSFPIMVILTYGVTLAVYELLVRRIWPLRMLFGLNRDSHLAAKYVAPTGGS